MKFLQSLITALRLSENDLKLLKKVFFFSLAGCVVVVMGVFIIQHRPVKKPGLLDAVSASDNTDLFALFIKTSGDILPVDIEAHTIAARKAVNEMEYTRAITHLLRILSVERNNREMTLELATAYLKAGRYDNADNIFRGLVDDKTADTLTEKIMARFGLSLFFNGSIDESIRQLEKTVTAFPASAETYCYLAQVEASVNLLSEKATAYLDKALALNPRYAEAWYQCARLAMSKPQAGEQEYIKARECLLRQLEIEPLNSLAHARLGMVYFYLRMPQLAEKSYTMALILNENDYNTRYNLGELYYSLFNDPKKALVQFQNTVRLKHDHAEAHYKIGLIALQNDQFKEAIHSFQQSLTHAPGAKRVLLQLGVAYEKMGMQREAIAAYESILAIDKLNDVALQKIKLLGGRR